MTPLKDIIPIWQPQGYSTNHLAKSIGDLYGIKATHTGTLDPMAEGVVIVLTGETRLKRQELSSLLKGYEFDIVFGISTDSFDGMGLVTQDSVTQNIDFLRKDLDIDQVQEVCSSFIGSYEQTVPVFSAQLYKGKKLFEYGHTQENVPLPTKKGEIYKFDVLSLEKVLLKDCIENIILKLKNIEGNFRQEQIITQWKNLLQKTDGTKIYVYKAKFYVETSRGLYVRSLSQDVCKKLNLVGFVSNLIRVKNGNYSKKDCSLLVDLFDKNYANIYGLLNKIIE